MAFACFDCQKSFKREVKYPSSANDDIKNCPNCGGEVQNMGRHFKAPKSGDRKQWEIV